jgi:hypothetical protein
MDAVVDRCCPIDRHATGTTSASVGYLDGHLGGDSGTIVNGQHDHRLVGANGCQPAHGCRSTDVGADVVV